MASVAGIVAGDHGAYVAGVETCGSVWSCTVCAGKIAEGRRKEVNLILSAHDRLGGHVFMCAFTIPHLYSESCHALRRIVAGTWQKMMAGKAWKKAQVRFGVVGFIRALEVTHGKNGWHPHLHVLMFTKSLTPYQQFALRLWLRDRWISILKRTTNKNASTRFAMDFRQAEGLRNAGDYVCKWGVDSEITKANVKFSKKGGRSPWQILSDAHDGDHASRMQFREYAYSFKGARQLTSSHGLKSFYNVRAEISDYDLAKSGVPHFGDVVIGTIRRGLWIKLSTKKLIPDLLSSAEADGWDGVLSFLQVQNLVAKETYDDKHDTQEEDAWASFGNIEA